MSFVPNFPPSLLQRLEDNDAGGETKKTKEDYKKMKELEEARKLAVMPAMKDEEGNEINPHIPQYIMQAPWYYGALHPTLHHQRVQDEKKREEYSGKMKGSTILNQWYKRGVPQANTNVKHFRDGACENCGAITHKRKECLERPRKVGAKFTGTDIAPDDYSQANLDLTYEAKRDRWNGYDSTEHKRLFNEYQRLEEARKLAKAKKLEEQLAKATEPGASGQEEPAASAVKPMLDEDGDLDMEDGDRYGDELDMPGQKFDTKQRQSIRNLRIREDTAKYLFNLDPNSAYYDPKTRAMRENPFEHTDKPESEVPFAGDNFVRYDGDVQNMVRRQVFAWEMHDKLGLNVHLQADPTRLEFLAKKVSKAKEDMQSQVREEILQRYGGREHLESLPPELRLGQWESYAEYSPTGRIILGVEKPTVKSRYEEDILINNHKCVWGSYWFNGRWGYKCCQSLVKESYCTGKKNTTACYPEIPDGPGSSAFLRPPPMPANPLDRNDCEDSAVIMDDGTPRRKGRKRKRGRSRSSSSNSSSSSCSSSSSRDSSSSTRLLQESCQNESVQPDLDDKQHKEDTEDEVETERSRVEKQLEQKRSDERRGRIRAHRANKKKKNREKCKRGRTSGKNKKKRSRSSSSSSSSSSELTLEDLQEFKIQEAIKREKARLLEVDAYLSLDERKRPYNSLAEVKEPTFEEMEAYHRTKVNRDDPMSHFE